MEEVKNCLINTLEVLKISSKESVENLEAFSPFKEYMHVERHVQRELIKLLEGAKKAHRSQLILVCGSVGDGKSHLLSYLQHHYKDLLEGVRLYNDASESFNPEDSDIDTLNRELDAFSDINLDSALVHKTVIAINLGTLSNFIESPYKERYSKLREFVYKHKILDNEVVDYQYKEESPFQFINFSDYHMYTLTSEGPRSQYIKELINKLVDKNNEDNIFYRSYCDHCRRCEYRFKCVVKINYSLLQKEHIRDGIVQALIQAMIREKLIISTRELLNFFNDLLVGGMSKQNIMKLNQKKESLEKILEQNALLLPNIMYEKVELSNIISKLYKLDPLTKVSKKLEEDLLHYQLTNEIVGSIRDDLKDLDKMFTAYIAEKVDEAQIQGFSQSKIIEIRYEFFKLYRRTKYLAQGELEEEIYTSYMKDLYGSNKKDKNQLKELFREVRDNLYRWDGSMSAKGIRVSSSKRHRTLGIYEQVSIKPYVNHYEPVEESELEKFVTDIVLSYTCDKGKTILDLNIDYALYELIKKMTTGYLPNKEEQNKNLTLQLFIEKLLKADRKYKEEDDEKQLIFEMIQEQEVKHYKLELDEFGQYEFS